MFRNEANSNNNQDINQANYNLLPNYDFWGQFKNIVARVSP